MTTKTKVKILETLFCSLERRNSVVQDDVKLN